jgi:hypothetical protein
MKAGFSYKRRQKNDLRVPPQRGSHRRQEGRLPAQAPADRDRQPPRHDGCQVPQVKRIPQRGLQLGMELLLPHQRWCQVPHRGARPPR